MESVGEAEMSRKDYRVMLTQKMFKTAFLQLLTVKPIQEITVRELCAEAGVNRGTFYSHYQNIYELLEQIEQEMYMQLQEIFANYYTNSVHSSESFYHALLEVFKQNYEMCIMLLGKNSDRNFVQKLLDYGKVIFLNTVGKQMGNNFEGERFYDFVSGGCLSVLQRWITSGMKTSIDNMAHFLQCVIESAVQSYTSLSKENAKK